MNLMEASKKATKKLEALAESGDAEAQFELGKRLLAGVLGAEKDLEGGLRLISKAAEGGDKTASAILEGIEMEDEMAASEAMRNLASSYSSAALDLDQNPAKRSEFLESKSFAYFWYRRSIDEGNPEALFDLAQFLYMLGGDDYEEAAVLLKYYWEIEGPRSDKAADILGKMLSRGWIKDGWNCYYDVICLLRDSGAMDTAEYELEYDPEAPVDDVTVDKIFEASPEYPGKTKESQAESGPSSRKIWDVLLNMGIKATYNKNTGVCKVRIHDCEDLPERLERYGYQISESRGYFVVKEKKKPKRLDP